MNRKFASYIVTFFGVGLVKIFPGFFGSLLAAFLCYFILFFLKSALLFILFNVGLFFIAYYSIDKYQEKSNESDPQEIVVDEVVGMSISMIGGCFFFNTAYFALAFIIFRVLDSFKPSIIYRFELDKKNSSILMDDVVASLLTLLIMLSLGSSGIV